ncbi:ABC transporter ATP-binding protein [Desulfobulbus alkaliphilus]|uniref:ABC transporter ATP-binding protein n=1 Tax=Desulfobulbus alkaliphilus TaxID=869814 RepID=UPI001962BEB2|nr:ATP-binding cassette domain-containing protein [Desulfobulbus alkaliphilus]MBM9537672.1 ABC transporter ATP-binding protein [Desulfobulbus alkaliphilus]
MKTLLDIKELTVSGEKTIVHPVSLQVRTREPCTILGETGCGKSLLAQAVMGVLPSELRAQGRIFLGERDLLGLIPKQRRAIWGRELAILPQEPWLALDPTMRVLPQVKEGYMVAGAVSGASAGRLAQATLSGLGLTDAAGKLPSELSGGMAQRVAFAAASVGGAGILLADEPTKGLDAQRWQDIVDLLLQKVADGIGLLTITHDIGVARRLGGHVAIMCEGRIVEQGPAARVLQNPVHPYSKRLLAADPASWEKLGGRASNGVSPVIKAHSLGITRGGKQLFKHQNFSIAPGEIVGVTGPSGCGKSTFGDLLLGLLQPDTGTVWRDGSHPPLRYQKLYQDPPAAFPRSITIGQAVEDLIRLHALQPGIRDTLMDELRLQPELLDRLPEQISGGELQRFALLRVLLLDPIFLFADEPTSRLDLITQQEMMNLLVRCARERQCAILLVSHHADLIGKVADRLLFLGEEAISRDAAFSACHQTSPREHPVYGA